MSCQSAYGHYPQDRHGRNPSTLGDPGVRSSSLKTEVRPGSFKTGRRGRAIDFHVLNENYPAVNNGTVCSYGMHCPSAATSQPVPGKRTAPPLVRVGVEEACDMFNVSMLLFPFARASRVVDHDGRWFMQNYICRATQSRTIPAACVVRRSANEELNQLHILRSRQYNEARYIRR